MVTVQKGGVDRQWRLSGNTKEGWVGTRPVWVREDVTGQRFTHSLFKRTAGGWPWVQRGDSLYRKVYEADQVGQGNAGTLNVMINNLIFA